MKILIGKVIELDYAYVKSKIDELCVSNMFFDGKTMKLMKEIVPEYVSNNSEFSKLDKKKPVSDNKEGLEKVLQS